MSWADKIQKAEGGLPRAQALLSRAQGRGSKGLIAADIYEAIKEAGAQANVHRLLDLYGLAYSSDGLRHCAEYLAKDLADPRARSEYLGIDS